MSVTYPESIYTAKKNWWHWIPAIANVATGPTVAEMTAGFAIHCSFDADAMQYEVSASKQEVQRYCDEFATVAPGRKTLTFNPVEVFVDPQQPTSVNYKLATAWIPEPAGFVALRAGLPTTTAIAAAQTLSLVQKVKVISLMLKAPDPTKPEDTYKWRFELLPTGDPIQNRPIAA